MRGLLFLIILLGFPTLEIYVLIKLSDFIGWWLLLVLLSGVVLGSRLVQEAGAMVPQRLFAALQSGHSPSLALLFGFRTVLAGLLFIFPGIISDALALLLLLLPAPKTPAPPAAANDENVIEGDWERVDDRDRLR
jgi:UPF0716 protein FxsA